MTDRCAEYWEGLIELAEGKPDEAARSHVQSCTACAQRLDQLHLMLQAARTPSFEAPFESIKRAKALMPERRRVALISSTLAWSGARAISEDFQLLVGRGETQVRLMYNRTDEGWNVLGRVAGGGFAVDVAGKNVSIDRDGRFVFSVASLADTGFTLVGHDDALSVPSAEELLASGTEGTA